MLTGRLEEWRELERRREDISENRMELEVEVIGDSLQTNSKPDPGTKIAMGQPEHEVSLNFLFQDY